MVPAMVDPQGFGADGRLKGVMRVWKWREVEHLGILYHNVMYMKRAPRRVDPLMMMAVALGGLLLVLAALMST
jgi:hypothetical protein